MDEGNHDYLSV